MSSLPLQADAPADPSLAERLRPRTLDQIIGQAQLLGPGKPLRTTFEAGRLHSMILLGPEGGSITILVRLMAYGFGARSIAISAVLRGVKDVCLLPGSRKRATTAPCHGFRDAPPASRAAVGSSASAAPPPLSARGGG